MNRISTSVVVTVLLVAVALVLSAPSSAESQRLFSMWQPHKCTPEELLRSAAFDGNIRKIKLLLAQGTAVDTRDKEGWTPLMWAQAGEQVEAIKLLLARGADINAKNDMGFTALHQAAVAGRDLALKVLLSHGSEVDSVSRSGYTPLMDAAVYGRAITVELLLAHGADPNAISVNGHTAVSLAEKKSHRNVAVLLVANGADPQLQARRLQRALAEMHTRTRGPSRVRLAGHMRQPEVLEDLCRQCQSRQADTGVTLISQADNDIRSKLLTWCRQSDLGRDTVTQGARRTSEDRLASANKAIRHDNSMHLLRQAVETWEQIQAKYPDTHRRMRDLSRKGMSLDKLRHKEPLLQRAMDIWMSLRSEHPELMSQLMRMVGMER
jgi:ankyrin repeat protein